MGDHHLQLIQMKIIETVLKNLKTQTLNFIKWINTKSYIFDHFYYFVLICFVLACLIFLLKKYIEMVRSREQNIDEKKLNLAETMLQALKIKLYAKKKVALDITEGFI